MSTLYNHKYQRYWWGQTSQEKIPGSQRSTFRKEVIQSQAWIKVKANAVTVFQKIKGNPKEVKHTRRHAVPDQKPWLNKISAKFEIAVVLKFKVELKFKTELP